MNAPTSLEKIAALDLDRRILHELLRHAQDDAHPRVIGRLLVLLAENAHATGQAWGTKCVERRAGERRQT